MIDFNDLVSSIKSEDIEAVSQQVSKMECEDVEVMGPMNMIAFDS